MGYKAQKYLPLMGKMHEKKGEQRKLNCCQLSADETADKITELGLRLPIPEEGQCQSKEAKVTAIIKRVYRHFGKRSSLVLQHFNQNKSSVEAKLKKYKLNFDP